MMRAPHQRDGFNSSTADAAKVLKLGTFVSIRWPSIRLATRLHRTTAPAPGYRFPFRASNIAIQLSCQLSIVQRRHQVDLLVFNQPQAEAIFVALESRCFGSHHS